MHGVVEIKTVSRGCGRERGDPGSGRTALHKAAIGDTPARFKCNRLDELEQKARKIPMVIPRYTMPPGLATWKS